MPMGNRSNEGKVMIESDKALGVLSNVKFQYSKMQANPSGNDV